MYSQKKAVNKQFKFLVPEYFMRREKIKNHTSWPLATDNPTLRLWVRGSAEDACCEQIFCLVASSLTREKNLIFPNFVTVEFYRGYWTVDDSCMSGAHYLSNGLLCMHVCLVTSNANDFSLFKSKTFAEFCFADFFFSKFLRIKCYFLSTKIKTRKYPCHKQELIHSL